MNIREFEFKNRQQVLMFIKGILIKLDAPWHRFVYRESKKLTDKQLYIKMLKLCVGNEEIVSYLLKRENWGEWNGYYGRKPGVVRGKKNITDGRHKNRTRNWDGRKDTWYSEY